MGGGYSLRPWWAWTIGSLLLGTAALVTAGLVLSSARLGTELRARACDPAPAGGVGMIALAAALVTFGIICTRLIDADAVLSWDGMTAVVAIPIPATLLVLTAPGVMGCAAASDVASLPLVGDALVGQAGTMLAAASAALLGVAAVSAAHVRAPGYAQGAEEHEEPGIVDLAVQEAEALEAEGMSTRFHGVDSDH